MVLSGVRQRICIVSRLDTSVLGRGQDDEQEIDANTIRERASAVMNEFIESLGIYIQIIGALVWTKHFLDWRAR